MSYPKRLLGEDEQVVLDLHPHWKVLAGPFLWVLLAIGAASYGAASVGGKNAVTLRWVFFGAAVLVIAFASVRPYLQWATTHYVVTNRRVVIRTGIVARQGRDVPLSRVNDVSFRHTVFERLLGCGTLTVESAGERGQVELSEVPHVEEVQRTVYRLAEAEDRSKPPLADGT